MLMVFLELWVRAGRGVLVGPKSALDDARQCFRGDEASIACSGPKSHMYKDIIQLQVQCALG